VAIWRAVLLVTGMAISLRDQMPFYLTFTAYSLALYISASIFHYSQRTQETKLPGARNKLAAINASVFVVTVASFVMFLAGSDGVARALTAVAGSVALISALVVASVGMKMLQRASAGQNNRWSVQTAKGKAYQTGASQRGFLVINRLFKLSGVMTALVVIQAAALVGNAYMTSDMSANLTEKEQELMGHVYSACDVITLAMCLWYFKSLVSSAINKNTPQETGPRQRPEISISESDVDSTGESFGRVGSSSGSSSGSPRGPIGLERQKSHSRLAFEARQRQAQNQGAFGMAQIPQEEDVDSIQPVAAPGTPMKATPF